MSSPRFLRVNFNFLFRASALMISPETKTGIPRAFITLEARLLPAPGIPTITSTVFLGSADRKGGSRTAGNPAVIALNRIEERTSVTYAESAWVMGSTRSGERKGYDE